MAACFIAAECGVNWNGDRSRIPAFIEAAKACGASASKWQAFEAAKLIARRSIKDAGTIALLERCELSDADLDFIASESKRAGLPFFASVFDPSQVERVLSRGACALKISHKEASYTELVKAATTAGKKAGVKVWISGDEQCSNVWGVWEYPATSKPRLNRLRERGYQGFSSHFKDECVPALAAVFCDYVEAHLALSVHDLEWEWSLNVAQFESLVRQARMFESWL